MILKHNGKTLASQVVFAGNIFSQMLGLMFRKSISQEFAMIFMLKKPMTLGVHMLCMRFPIDTIFLDEEKKIIAIETLRPWVGHKRMKGVKYLIEMNKGIAEKFGLKIGEIISFD
jgi:uncharacterized membrane protein (UPF0127 family)